MTLTCAVQAESSLERAFSDPPSSPKLRQSTFGATLDFIEALCDASAGLTSFAPVRPSGTPSGTSVVTELDCARNKARQSCMIAQQQQAAAATSSAMLGITEVLCNTSASLVSLWPPLCIAFIVLRNEKSRHQSLSLPCHLTGHVLSLIRCEGENLCCHDLCKAGSDAQTPRNPE